MNRIIFLSCLFFAATAEGLLPPFYQSLNEYKALLATPEFVSHFEPGEAIRDIQRTDKGFVIATTRQSVEVEVIYEPLDQPGPAKFHFTFHPASNKITTVKPLY